MDRSLAGKHAKIPPVAPMRIAILTRAGEQIRIDSNKLDQVAKICVELHNSDESYPLSKYDSKQGVLGSGVIRYPSRPEDPVRDFAFFKDDGSFFWVCTLMEDFIASLREVGGTTMFSNAIAVGITLKYIVMSLLHARKYCSDVYSIGSWVLRFGFVNIANRHMIIDSPNFMPPREKRLALESNIFIEQKISPNMPDDVLEILAVEMVVEIMRRFHWSMPPHDWLGQQAKTITSQILKR